MFKLKVFVKDDRKILILRRNVIRFPGKEPRRLLEADIFCVSFQKGENSFFFMSAWKHSFMRCKEYIIQSETSGSVNGFLWETYPGKGSIRNCTLLTRIMSYFPQFFSLFSSTKWPILVFLCIRRDKSESHTQCMRLGMYV